MSKTATKTQLQAAVDAFEIKKDKTVDKAYVTSDDQVFFSENNATNHTKSLKDREIVIVTREEAAKAKSESKEGK